MSVDEQFVNINVLLNNEKTIPNCLLKKPYIPPQIIPIFQLNIENNFSGAGDGDAAFAHFTNS